MGGGETGKTRLACVEDGEDWRQSSGYLPARPRLTACACKAEQASSRRQPEPAGVEKDTDNRKLQLNATVTFAEDVVIT